jgi:hypothetical protein
MAANMKDNGELIRQMEKGFSIIQMEIFTRAVGSMIKPMGKEFTLIQTEPNTLDNGKMISSTVSGFKNGLMDKNMKASIEMVLKLERVFSAFWTQVTMRANSLIIKFMGKVKLI